ncbi:Maltose/maltodextrin import ATP-binding protein MalK [Pleomorphomonas sp. T1.2MG-36]|uniref:ABC transporter ATP-binding protein n=1 Tax=Pleomorphomonas sp. T1.2MG-36 TaxID=3041167 RepID=UPI00247759CB|nr:sn-glycerol-3-phosphate ABC transporter ATP-binding protein UgpC [Pleomorphomonas sp. T1.2MG-36]CAI9405715.1 Maltose/maltodextrin import ATP-binding protein MalK [Pleomorphomonas sp. T1.2MG-36]
MASLTMRNVRKSFGRVEIIKGVDLDIADGEFVVFVGPSGCGKSTLLRMVAGLEEITSGEILIDDKLCNDIAPKDRGIAMVFQSYALYPHKSVYANMAFALEIAGFSKTEIAEKVDKAAKILHIEHLLDRKPGQLSGGQRQRVAIGRAIVREPKIFLFDEPLSNLDAALRVSTRAEIAKLHEDLGSTMVYVTHDQVEAMTLADKIVVLEAGNVRQVGAPLELYHRPQNLFVAGFIGSPKMNFLKVKSSAVDADGITVAGDGVPTLKVAVTSTGASVGEDLTLGIRPEHIKLGTEGGLPVTVTFVERLGHQTIVQAHRGDDETSLIAVLDGDVPVKAGEQRQFVFSGTDCHLFNAQGVAYPRGFVPE